MKGVSVFLLIGLFAGWGSAQFLNNRPWPTYSLEHMPDTGFTCRDKILGGYYADAETQCQMFHVCVKVAGVGVQDFRFLCPNGTAFDQDHQICADWEDVDCDATTLYYSSDNFDLYRVGSGFESKAVKYGEDEETFALQRAETGDARLNREHQAQRVNQKQEPTNPYYNNNKSSNRQTKNNNNNNERDIFKGSSSSNFFNNRNNGKETDEDYDDNVNVNQDRDTAQKRKIVRKQQRRPANQNTTPEEPQPNKQQQSNNNRPQQQNRPQQNINRPQQQQQQNKPQVQQNNRPQQQSNNRPQQQPIKRPQQKPEQKEEEEAAPEARTYRPAPTRPAGFVNNFAGSSYVPSTTSRPTTTTLEPTTTTIHPRQRNSQRVRSKPERYNDAETFRQNTNSPSPTYTISTPAPFRQTQQYNNPPVRQNTQTTKKATENYPTQQRVKQTQNYPTTASQNFNGQYDVPKVKPTNKQNDNYPTTAAINYNTQYDVPKVKSSKQAGENYPTQYQNKPTTFSKTDNYPSNNPQYYEKKPTTPVKQNDNYPTTFSPKGNSFPTTFAPRTNAAYTQISKQTTHYNTVKQNNNNEFNNQKPTGQFHQQFNNNNNNNGPISTPKTTAFTQYTPTVPKITSTTPISRSNRFDETQYDDGSYSTKYDYDNGDKKDDEFLKTAHSQNIASSRNEFAKSTSKAIQQQTQKPYYESPRPFSVSPNTPKVTDYPKSTPVNNNNYNNNNSNYNNNNKQPLKPVDNQKQVQPTPKPKKVKDVSYDYAYYDTNASSEPDYEIDTEFKKSTVKN